MNRRRLFLWMLLVATVLTPLASGQSSADRLSSGEAGKLYESIGDYMQATSLAMPELARAGEPLVQNVRQSAELLRAGNTREHVGILYRLLRSAKIYLQIAEAVSRPAPLAEEIERQLRELRAQTGRAEKHFRAQLEAKERRLRSSDRDNLARYAEQNRLLTPAASGTQRVVFLGDSITDGWRLNQYFPGEPYVNRGIGGQITSQMLGRMQADVLALAPKAVVILAGTNDLARGITNEAIQNNLSMIADLAVAHGIRPVFSSILPVSDHHKEANPNFERTPGRPPFRILELNQWIRAMCRRRGFVYLDYFAATADSAGFLRADLADDGLHPNTEGYRIMAPLAHKAIQDALKRRRPAPQKKKRFGIF